MASHVTAPRRCVYIPQERRWTSKGGSACKRGDTLFPQSARRERQAPSEPPNHLHTVSSGGSLPNCHFSHHNLSPSSQPNTEHRPYSRVSKAVSTKVSGPLSILLCLPLHSRREPIRRALPHLPSLRLLGLSSS